MVHNCDVIVVCCIDFRFQKLIREWTDTHLADKTFDLVGFTGSSKDLPTVMSQIDVSVRLHQIKQVVLIHHQDCGSYGQSGTFERQSADMKKARQAIQTAYPGVSVLLYFATLEGEFLLID